MTDEVITLDDSSTEGNPWDVARFGRVFSRLPDPEIHPFLYAHQVGKLCVLLPGRVVQDPENPHHVMEELENHVRRVKGTNNDPMLREAFFEGLLEGMEIASSPVQ